MIKKNNKNLTTKKSSKIKHSEYDKDELYLQAEKLINEAGRTSSAMLQRRLAIGYARAARYVDIYKVKHDNHSPTPSDTKK